MELNQELQALAFFLPEGTLRYFDIVSSKRKDEGYHITMMEKDDPPLGERHRGMSVLSKGFQDITVTDFPVRGKKMELTFRRRRWQVGSEVVKREIDLRAPGTRLEKEFGFF